MENELEDNKRENVTGVKEMENVGKIWVMRIFRWKPKGKMFERINKGKYFRG
jgi:hypothetical protein